MIDQIGGAVLALFSRAELAKVAQLAAEGSGFGGITLACCTRTRAAVDAVLVPAVKAGATLLKPALDVFWSGDSGYFANPDGPPWEVAWNPDRTLREDGSVERRRRSWSIVDV